MIRVSVLLYKAKWASNAFTHESHDHEVCSLNMKSIFPRISPGEFPRQLPTSNSPVEPLDATGETLMFCETRVDKHYRRASTNSAGSVSVQYLSGVNFHAARSFCDCSSWLRHVSISRFICMNSRLTAGSSSIDCSCDELGFNACFKSDI